MKILKQQKHIVLHSHPICGWCQEAKEWLDERKWTYEVRDTGSDPTARQRAIEISGQSLVLVIEVDGLVLGDFAPGNWRHSSVSMNISVKQASSWCIELGHLHPTVVSVGFRHQSLQDINKRR